MGEQRRFVDEKREKPHVSLWDQARDYLQKHGDRFENERKDTTLGKRYGQSIVRSKIDVCAENLEACAAAYIARRQVTGREVNPGKTRVRLEGLIQKRLRLKQEKVVKKITKQIKGLELRAELYVGEKDFSERLSELRHQLDQEKIKLEGLPLGRDEKDADDLIFLEEASQEYALQTLDAKTAEGMVDPASLNAHMMVELALSEKPERRVDSLEGAVQAMHDEVQEFMDKGFLNQQEARVIKEYGDRYAKRFVKAFDKRLGDRLVPELYEAIRDNARKVAYQTKIDKQTLAGSDHGARHIYEGNTHFAEQLMDSLRDVDGVDFKTRDEVLIRQIIIDHDMGYTTPAARMPEGGGAAKDHPCVGCRYVEANASYYQRKFGQHGYEVARDVLLNHSYPTSKYSKQRPDPTKEKSFTYNRQLIRSVVSTVDSLSVTAETKAMDLFRNPEAVDILQNAQRYAETQEGILDEKALQHFKDQLHALADRLVEDKKVSSERGQAYRAAINHRFEDKILTKTLGQYVGVVRAIRLMKDPSSGEFVPEVRMDLSRLQALVSEMFGDPVSLAGFKKAMEAFGIDAEEWKRLTQSVKKLRSQQKRRPSPDRTGTMRFSTARAHFVVGERETTGLRDEREEEHRAIVQRFEVLQGESMQEAVNQLFEKIRHVKKPRSPLVASTLGDQLCTLFDVEDEAQRQRLLRLGGMAVNAIDDDQTLEFLQQETRRFLSKGERARLHHLFMSDALSSPS